MEITNEKLVCTKKPHVCFGCRREFPEKTKMSRLTYVDGRKIFTDYFCKTCQEIKSDMRHGDELGYGDLRSEALNREEDKND